MADNTTLPGTGEVVRDLDRTGVKTQIFALDLNPAGAETLMAGTLPVSGTITAVGVVVTTLPALPAGTNTIGTVAVSGTAAVSGTVTSVADQTVISGVPLTGLLRDFFTTTTTTATAGTNLGATSGKKNHICTVIVYNSSTTNTAVDIKDGTAGSVIATIPCPANGGAVVNFPFPLRQPTANTAIAFAAQNAITTLSITLVGFQAA